MLLVHRRDIVEPVEIRDRLQIGLVLDQLLGAAMQQADMRIDALDDLAVEFQHQAQHAVRGRMLRAEIDGEVSFAGGLGHVLVIPWPRRRQAQTARTLRAGHVVRLVGEVVIGGLLVDEDLRREGDILHIIERLGRDKIHVLVDQPIIERRATRLAEAALGPFGRTIGAKICRVIDLQRRPAIAHHERSRGPAAAHAAMADTNVMIGRRRGKTHVAAQTTAGLLMRRCHHAALALIAMSATVTHVPDALLQGIPHEDTFLSGSPVSLLPWALAFSSPGSRYSVPSHGDRKSKLRNSWLSRTGS